MGRAGRVTWRAGAGLRRALGRVLRVVFTAPHAPLPVDVAARQCRGRADSELGPGASSLRLRMTLSRFPALPGHQFH